MATAVDINPALDVSHFGACSSYHCPFCGASFENWKTYCCCDRIAALLAQGLTEDQLGEFRVWLGL